MFPIPDSLAGVAVHVVLAFTGGLLYCSFGEHLLHRYLMHRRNLPEWCYRAVPDLQAHHNGAPQADPP